MSKEHYTRNTVAASAYCKVCGKWTMHRVDADSMQGRLGPCLDCMRRRELEKEQRKGREAIAAPEAKQEKLF